MPAKMTFQKAAKLAGIEFNAGKQAIKKQFRNQINVGANVAFVSSADLDDQYKKAEPNASRWDYVVGFSADKHFVIWIESHPASGQKDLHALLRKLSWLKDKLTTESYSGFSDLTEASKQLGYTRYRWIYSGKSSYRAGGTEEKLLAKHGMRLPERNLTIE